MGGQPRLQRLQPPAGAADPARQGRAFDPDAVAGEDLGLAIERRVVAVLADQNLGDEPRRGQTLGDRTVGSRISRIVFSQPPVPAARFCLIFAPSWATMSQKLSLMQSAQSVQ